jgi:exopolyphosphatase/guanosine-5'-triphosphate,3'-diphosphate pyrophosphatase
MTVAAIDIGTNTVLLLIARVTPDGRIVPTRHEQRLPRLGTGVDASRRLSSPAMRRVADVLQEYRALIDTLRADVTTVCATSAVRDATNRGEFLRFILETTGLVVEVLSGDEEARWTYRGAVSGLDGVHTATVVDIGGGSTEITTGSRHEVTGRMSIDLGAVRLTERVLQDDPPTPEQIRNCLRTIREGLRPVAGLRTSGSRVLGVAGTATTLALLDQGRKEFDLAAVSGYRLTLDAVRRLAATLGGIPSGEILRMSKALEGRADIITAGTLILQEVMVLLGCGEITVSERGVRYGLALRAAEHVSGSTPAA